jgi:coenzyme F420-reducing hydrogenase beta subunit
MEVKTIAVLDIEHCTGCGVCATICAGITMHPNDRGFLYPQVHDDCTNCGECNKRCPVLNKPNPQVKTLHVYAAWSLNNEVRYKSTSGGIFTELAKRVLELGGFVAGARYNSSHLVEHALIDCLEDIPVLRQSKYVQSDTKGIYASVSKALKAGKLVLFVGTPCQCVGLSNYLGAIPDNLYICDFICRGVNSPAVYLKYLRELEERLGSVVKHVWFKNKTYGWNQFGTKVIFADGQEYFGNRDEDPFMLGYIKTCLNLYMRPSCYQCEFKGVQRVTDITLGDFWGVKLKNSDDDLRGGVSAVIVHSDKGKNLFGALSGRIFAETHSIDEVAAFNVCLNESVPENKSMADFYERLRCDGFLKTMSTIKELQ